MSAVPPSCVQYTLRGSGSPVIYGASTIGTNHPIRTYAPPSRVIQVMPTSGNITGFFAELDGRYDTPPTGWNTWLSKKNKGGLNPPVSNPLFWLKPGAGFDYSDSAGTIPVTTTGGSVVRRNSLVGNGYIVNTANNATLQLNQINGNSCIRHAFVTADGTTLGWTMNNVVLSSGQAWTMGMAQKCAARGQPHPQGCGLAEMGTSNYLALYNCAPLTVSDISSDDQEVFVWQSNGSNVIWRQQGVTNHFQTGTQAPYATGIINTNLALFGLHTNGSWPYVGDDYEVLIYDRLLSSGEITSLENYLLNRTPIYKPNPNLPAIVYIGDSITAGAGATLNANSWADLSASMLAPSYDRVNLGIGGSTLRLDWIPGGQDAFNIVAVPYYSANFPQFNVFISLGTDDLINGDTAAGVKTNLIALANQAKALGSNVKVIIGSVITRDNMTSGQNVQRLTFNSGLLNDFNIATPNNNIWLKGSGVTYGDVLCDFAALTIERGDGTHPTDIGNATMAPLAYSGIIAAPSILMNGLAGYYKMSQASGTSLWLDSLGNNHLTQHGSVSSASGILGTAGVFDTNNYLQASNANVYDYPSGQSFTFACWVYPTTLSAFGMVIGKNFRYDLRLGSVANTWDFTRTDGVGSSATTGTVTANTWHFLCAWYDAVAGTLNLSVNNNTPVTITNTPGIVNTDTFEIGARTGANPFIGRIDEVGVWNRVLTSAEITKLYNGGSAVTYPVFS